MFGECHAHAIMDGKNYRAAVDMHKNGVRDEPVREHLSEWRAAGISFVRDGGDALRVSVRARDLAPEYGIDYRTPVYAIHKRGHYGGIVGLPFSDMRGYRDLVLRAKHEGADFIKIMISGIMDFGEYGRLSEDGLSEQEIAEMINIAHGEEMCVMAHVNGDRAARAAVKAGLDTLEHGNYMEKETLDILSESRTIWVPTFAPTGNQIGSGRFPDEQLKRILQRQSKSVEYAFSRGARLGMGSDSGAHLVPHGQGLIDEYGYMLKAVGEANREKLDAMLADSEARIKKEMKRVL